jgi:hypothetical protein
MTLPRPPIRTLDMRPLAKPLRRSRIKGAIVGVAILAMAVVVGNNNEAVRGHVREAAAAEVSNIAVTATAVALDPAPTAVQPPVVAAEPAAPVSIKLKRFDKQARHRVVKRKPSRVEPKPMPVADPPVVEAVEAPIEVTPAAYEPAAPSEPLTTDD